MEAGSVRPASGDEQGGEHHAELPASTTNMAALGPAKRSHFRIMLNSRPYPSVTNASLLQGLCAGETRSQCRAVPNIAQPGLASPSRLCSFGRT